VFLLLFRLSVRVRGASVAEDRVERKRLFNGHNSTVGPSLSATSMLSALFKKEIDPKTDPKAFKVVKTRMILVSGAEYGSLTTVKEYQDYHLTVEFAGQKNRLSRIAATRCVTQASCSTVSALTRSGRSHLSVRIQEGIAAILMVSGTCSPTIDGKVEKSYKKKQHRRENRTGEWNTIEVDLVMAARSPTSSTVSWVNEGTDASVTKGRILLQSSAEVCTAEVELRPLKK